MQKHHKVIIIGSGPAGISAAIHTGRSKLEPVIISGNPVGGQLIRSRSVTNWPGIEAIPGAELIKNLEQHALSFNTTMIIDEVVEASLSSTEKKITLASGAILTADTVIIACGGKPKQLECLGAKAYWHKGIYMSIPKEHNDFTGKTVTIIGGGNSGIGVAQRLLNSGAQVIIVHHKKSLAANDPAVELVKSHKNTQIFCSYAPIEVQGSDDRLTALSIRHNETQEQISIAIDMIITTIGSDPKTDLFVGQLATSASGHILVQPGTTLTSLPGVFAAGDVMDNRYRHAITSAAQGFMAGIDAENYLKSLQS